MPAPKRRLFGFRFFFGAATVLLAIGVGPRFTLLACRAAAGFLLLGASGLTGKGGERHGASDETGQNQPERNM